MKQTVGRVVLFKGNPGDPILPAIVVQPHSDTCVSLVVFNCWGENAPAVAVTSVSQGDLQTGTRCWNWPTREGESQ